MKLKKTLSKMVSSAPPVSRGNVMDAKNNYIYVSTPDGIKEFQVSEGSKIRSGDVVRFQGSTLLGRVPSEEDSTVYIV